MSDSPSPALDVFGAFDALREAYLRYYDTPFGLADEELEAERRALLDRPGGVYTEPLVELRPEYTSTGCSLAESAARAGAPAELAAFAACGLLPAGRSLYTHQEQALRAGLRPGRNMVITAGTGSGKTESFLLPVIASLLAESAAWGGGPAPFEPWWRGNGPFRAQRADESGRPAAVRTLVLYPMNALVDDQLIRLRRALDSDEARRWLDRHRRGHRFTFGRYTGATPVTGEPGDSRQLSELRDYLRETEKRARQAHRNGGDARFFVPRLDGAEMRSRWDMAAAPPDILITNYSMLNIMLGRSRDQSFFDTTRDWLAAHPEHRFTLVVDELHLYRGTAGTEVAYLLRNLRHRLGVADSPEQFRILAASASLSPERDRRFLAEFFAADADAFDFVAGTTVQPTPGTSGVGAAAGVGGVALGGAAARLFTDAAAEPTDPSPEQAAELLARTGGADALRAALHDPEHGGTVTRAADDLASRLFPVATRDEREASLRGLLRVLRSAAGNDGGGGLPKIRAHFFFRNVSGIWACTDPICPVMVTGSGGDTGERGSGVRRRPGIGRLYAQPRERCLCGARVLELVFCQSCGDVMLGGFTVAAETERRLFNAELFPDVPELRRLPEQAAVDRTAANYVVYWPSDQPQQADDDATWKRGDLTFTFRRSTLDPRSGLLRNIEHGSTGWSFHVEAKRGVGVDRSALPPFPTRCPACGADWEITYRRGSVKGRPLAAIDPQRYRSPVRLMRTGFEKVNQVLVTELAGQLDATERKVLLFSDSRQDAAKMAAGVGLRHYQDLVRLLLVEIVEEDDQGTADVDLARRWTQGDRTPESKAAFDRLRERSGTEFNALLAAWIAGDVDPSGLEANLSQPPTLRSLVPRIQERLLRMGVNPAGPQPSRQHHGKESWYRFYDWSTGVPVVRGTLTASEQASLLGAEDDLLENVIENLLSGAGRDFESLGLGWLDLRPGTSDHHLDPTGDRAIARASVRILAELRRLVGYRDGNPRPPRRLTEFWKAVARAHRLDPDEVAARAARGWGNAVREYLVDPAEVVVRRPGDTAWTCPACRRQHLHPGALVCTRCRAALPTSGNPPRDAGRDYYGWKASTGHGRFRLSCAELTGQTGRTERQRRQAMFQEVFLDGDEIPLAQGVDLLSVTTTMEAGIDIGALAGVAMANMPPTRYNYQQRVGRAGRRDSPVAVALTVCRGRSHDEHYFQHPVEITNDPTPPPYLAMGQREILDRSLSAAVLTAAFRALPPDLRVDGRVPNVHGEFGAVDEWDRRGPHIRRWLAANTGTVTAIFRALSAHTSLRLTVDEAIAGLRRLPEAIDTVAARPVGHEALSQRLAEAGLLPMFGFPTQVRLLHLSRPTRSFPWPPDDVVDRDLSIALSQFAPGSEIVRDGSVHTVVGVTSFQPSFRGPKPVDEPLAYGHHLGLCMECNHVGEVTDPELTRPTGQAGATGAAAMTAPAGAADCPACGRDGYRVVETRQPLGFRAGAERDFDGAFTWSPRRIVARATSDLDKLEQSTTDRNLVALSGRGSRYIVNENLGRLFAFRRTVADPWGGYLEAATVDRVEDQRIRLPAGDTTRVALGAVLHTDLLFVGSDIPTLPGEGLRLNIADAPPRCAADISQGLRTAWYSLAFLLRSAAAKHLDVQTQEITAGIHSSARGGEQSFYAFLADTLENGAGFSSHLGEAAELPRFLDTVERYLGGLDQDTHADECVSSCYRCLRDYTNMAYHPLLDWRVARDLLSVLRRGTLPASPEREERVLGDWADAHGAAHRLSTPAPSCLVGHGTRQAALVVKHPLEAFDHTVTSRRLEKTVVELAASGVGADDIVITDFHTLEMSPMVVKEALGAVITPRRR
ncbi:DEAD/DEAH box helicase [Frankia sp. Cpl3]|nr:DEAD/DEAH box helicase [Frankia sp. Cpl3]